MRRHPALAGIIFVFLCLLPLMYGRDFTPDNELRYLQIADEAIENGSIFTFTNDGRPYADKPPLFLWLIMLLKLAAGEHSILLLSLLSFIPAAIIACVMDKWLVLASEDKGLSIDSGTRLATVLMLFTSGMFCGTCFFLRMDMLMTMFIVLAFYSFYRSYTFAGTRGCMIGCCRSGFSSRSSRRGLSVC